MSDRERQLECVIADLVLECKELRRENGLLERWKQEQLTMTPDWQKVGELLRLPIGVCVPNALEAAITKLLRHSSSPAPGI